MYVIFKYLRHHKCLLNIYYVFVNMIVQIRIVHVYCTRLCPQLPVEVDRAGPALVPKRRPLENRREPVFERES